MNELSAQHFSHFFFHHGKESSFTFLSSTPKSATMHTPSSLHHHHLSLLSLFLFMGRAVAFVAVGPFTSRRLSFLSVPTTTTPPLAAATSTSTTITEKIPIALTREVGKNEKLLCALHKSPLLSQSVDTVELLELACIEHAHGPDYDQLVSLLRGNQHWDYVAVTSPEAARVLASAIPSSVGNEDKEKKIDFPYPIAAVGKATEATLESLGLSVSFCPTKATAKVLVDELPGHPGMHVLYPASAQAKPTIQKGLQDKRGMHVTRLNTYDTVTATWRPEQQECAQRVRIACFASPSAVKGWVQNTMLDNSVEPQKPQQVVLAACIGETSALECQEQGWRDDQIFYPEKPGIDGWVESIGQAIDSLQRIHA
jgi:uroporphyrinogen-III synthase